MKGTLAFILSAVCTLQLDAQTVNAMRYGYLIESIKVPTDSGSIDYPVGTRVVLLSEKDGKTTVKAQEREFVIETAQVTQDVGVVQKLQEKEMPVAVARPAPATPCDKLRALERQGLLVKDAMDRASAAMHQIPHKGKPRTPEERANNERHDALKKQYDEFHAQYTRILEQERLLRRESR